MGRDKSGPYKTGVIQGRHAPFATVATMLLPEIIQCVYAVEEEERYR
jgi:hypothetical protein